MPPTAIAWFMQWRNRLTIACFCVGMCAAAGCQRDSARVPATEALFGLHTWALPAPPGSAQPNVAQMADGRLLLSWLNRRAARRTQLQYADFSNGHWGATKTIAIGSSFVVNWADTPHIAASANGALWVQWLQSPATQPGSQWTMLSTSRDDGTHWSTPVRVHDGERGEYGFAALYPVGDGGMGVVWVQSESAASAAAQSTATDDRSRHAHARDTQPDHGLQAAVFDAGLQRGAQVPLSAEVCECCQPAAAALSDGAVVLYRGRDAQQIRDIHAVRRRAATWQPPARVHADGWRISACPVNGAAVAAHGDRVIAAWYTGADDVPTMKLARSDDAAVRFSAPVVVDRGPAVIGRAQVAMDAHGVWIAWLREDTRTQSLWLARYSPDLSRELERLQIATLRARGPASGFPQLAVRDGVAYMVWTDTDATQPALHGARYRPH